MTTLTFLSYESVIIWWAKKARPRLPPNARPGTVIKASPAVRMMDKPEDDRDKDERRVDGERIGIFELPEQVLHV